MVIFDHCCSDVTAIFDRKYFNGHFRSQNYQKWSFLTEIEYIWNQKWLLGLMTKLTESWLFLGSKKPKNWRGKILKNLLELSNFPTWEISIFDIYWNCVAFPETFQKHHFFRFFWNFWLNSKFLEIFLISQKWFRK